MKKLSLEDILMDWLSSSDSEAEASESPSKLKNNSVIDKSVSINCCSKETTGHRNNGVKISGCKSKVQEAIECGNDIKRNTSSCRSDDKKFFNCRRNAEEISCTRNVEETLPCKKDITDVSGCVSDTEETTGCKSDDEDISNIEDTSDCIDNAEEILSCRSNMKKNSICKSNIEEVLGFTKNTDENSGFRRDGREIPGGRCESDKSSGRISYPVVNLEKMKKLSLEDILKDWLSSSDSETESSKSPSKLKNNSVIDKSVSNNCCSKETTGHRNNGVKISDCKSKVQEAIECGNDIDRNTSSCKRAIEEISDLRSDTKTVLSSESDGKNFFNCRRNAEEISCTSNVEETLPCKKDITEVSGCVSDTEETTGCKSDDEDISNIEDTSDCIDNAEEILSCRSNMKKNSICKSNIEEVLGVTKNTDENSGFKSDGKKIPGGRCESDKSSGRISYPVVNLGFRCDAEDKALRCSDSHNALFVTSKFSFSSNDSKKLTSKATKVFEIATKDRRKMENNDNSILLKRKVHSKQGNNVKVKFQDDLRSSKTYKITSCHDNVPVFQEVKQKLEDENEIIHPIHRTEWDSKDYIEVAVIIDKNQDCSSKNQIDNSSSVLNSGHVNNTFDKTNIITNNIQKLDKKHKVNKSRQSKLCTGKSQYPEVIVKSSDNFSRACNTVSELPDESKKIKKYETSKCTSDINLRINDISASSYLPVINSTEAREDIKTNFSNVELRNTTNPNDIGPSVERKPIRKRPRKCNNFFVHKSKLCTEIKPHVKRSVDQATQITQDSHCELVSQLCFECKVCHERFRTKLLLNRHATMHEASECFECDYCGYKSQRRGTFVRHIYIHQGKARHQCGICGKTFTYSQKYNYHLWSHRKDRPYNCDVCGKGYMQYESLYKHMSLHTGNMVKYDCSLCSKVFASRTGLNWHIRSFHRKETRCCPHCFNRYSVGNLGQHVKRCTKKNSC